MPVDFIGRGVAFPLRVGTDGGLATVGGLANLEKAMRVILLTRIGERPMRPSFGSRLSDFLFEGVSTQNAAAIADEVRRALTQCEPRARIDDVVVKPADTGIGRYDIDISYTVLASNDEHNLVVPFYSIPGEEA